MQFSRLRLAGFKSFVDPTEIVIAPGLTGVVGPNGCGKSNLLEALRWAMGENRPSVMRGDGMDDVIFAGSSTRPARNHAEVTLTLDNRERRAPAGFNDADQLEIARRITRDAGSAWRVNGREARARDVAMLFSDASTGAQSPALVRQGQIAELIDARPKARRRILEEAAGIAGLYQRRHEAELKLRATEANLGRLADVLEALDGQLAALARQARQAARYREIAAALRAVEALTLWRHWHDAEAERAAADAALTQALRAAAAAETEAAAAGRARTGAEDALPALREEDAIAGAVLQRTVVERDRLEGEAEAAARDLAALDGQIAQIAADRDREAALDRDAAELRARLADEDAGLVADGTGYPAAWAAAEAAAGTAAAALGAAEAAFDACAEAAARLVAEHQAAERARTDAWRRADDAARAAVQAGAARDAAARERAAAEAALGAARGAAGEATAAATAAEGHLAEAEAEAATGRAAEVAARACDAEVAGTARALAAEGAGIERLLARDAGGRGLLDAVTVAPGFEAALGAALADDLEHPAGDDGTGWRRLAPVDPAAALPQGAAPLAAVARAPEELARRLAATGVVGRADGPRLQQHLAPGQRLVSREGDLWRWDGLAVAAGAPGAAALRLQQKNRLAEVSDALAVAEAARSGHAAVLAAATAAAAAAVRAEAEARAARKAADHAAADAARTLGRAETAAEGLVARLAGLEAACRRRSEEDSAARAALADAEAAAGGLADPTAAREAVAAARVRLDAARIATLTRRGALEALVRAEAARERRRGEIGREADDWTRRQASAAGRLADLDGRAAAAEAARAAARGVPGRIAARRTGLGQALDAAEARRRRAADGLAAAETARRACEATARAAEKTAGEAREARARAEAVAEAAGTRAAAATDRLRGELDLDPADVPARFGTQPEAVAPAAALEAEADRLRRARDALGAVNLRADEDAAALDAERAALAGECTDLEAAIAKLRQGIASLNREGRGRLLAAFDEVNRNFSALFRHLFGGGEANLVMVESDDPLEAGLEILCQPPGKKVSTLSLLSGGEQTLTALSLIFGVFLANPSPICVLDEVDAPLDDANVGRFCDLLDEMTGRTATRFLIITHHAVTMARMDRLYGVTMVEPGVSQLVSVDLADAERIVELAV